MKRIAIIILFTLLLAACSSGDGVARLDNPQNLQKPEFSYNVSPTVTPIPSETVYQTPTPILPTATFTRTPTNTPTFTVTPSPTPTDECLVKFERSVNLALLSQINAERLLKGLDGFEISPEMEGAAERHLRDLVCHNILGHTGSDGSSPEERAELYGVEFTNLVELVLPESETLDGIEILMENDTFIEILSDPEFKYVGMAYSHEAYAGKNGVFVLVFFY